ncbi:hypothetical protein DU972_003797 [Vibrio mimicus]|nr:hypothetical protein [Vibrio cholerae]
MTMESTTLLLNVLIALTLPLIPIFLERTREVIEVKRHQTKLTYFFIKAFLMLFAAVAIFVFHVYSHESQNISGNFIKSFSDIIVDDYDKFSLSSFLGSGTEIDASNAYHLWFATYLFILAMFSVLYTSRSLYDVFISVPMSFATEDEYQDVKAKVGKISKALKESGFKRIYCAMENVDTTNNFNAPNLATIEDMNALKRSKKFLLYMPTKVPTSAIFEAGYAQAKRMPSVYMCHNSSDLPFMMKDLNDLSHRVNKYEAQSIIALVAYIKKYKKRIFSGTIIH